jgi:serine/threonine-protein kinase
MSADSRQKPDALVGQLIANRYRIVTLIGTGGMCVVYRAEDLKRGREVAVKVLPAVRARVDEFARRFQREITTTQRIDHPHVATIMESGTLEDGSQFLVMELLLGRLLSKIIAGGPLDEQRALGIARQTLVGLGAAHKEGIVHRDIKPGNVMIVDVNGLETVKLFDFGIASNDKAAMKLTIPGAAFGTPAYISPEMAMGFTVDERADLYGVGVTLFEMVTGRLPFDSHDDIQLLREHINSQPPSPRSLRPNLSAATEQIILRALRKKPETRYANAAEMVQAIDKVLGHGAEPEAASPQLRSGFPWLAVVLLALAMAAVAWWFLQAH